jgi:hypothetical protein
MDAFHLRIVLVMLIVGTAAGFAMHRADYCLTSMIRDVFLLRSTHLLRTLLLAVAAGAVSFEFLRRLGISAASLFAPAGMGHLAGGAIFGVGMVIAGGCVIGTLYRMGTGQVLSWAAFGGLVAGNWIYAEIHPAVVRFQAGTVLFGGSPTLPGILGISPLWLIAPLAAVALAAGISWRHSGTLDRASYARGDLQPWKAGLLLAALNTAAVAAAGVPMGVTTTYAKAAAWVASFASPSHTATLDFFTREPIRVEMPALGGVFTGGAAPVADTVLAAQLPLILGILAGAFVSAVSVGEFAFRVNAPWRQYASAVAGGILMTLGARIGYGCNIYHLFGGLPALASGSLLFLAALFPGAWLGVLILEHFTLRKSSIGAAL